MASVEAMVEGQEPGIVIVVLREIRIQLVGAAELAFGAGPVPLVVQLHLGHRRMRIGQIRRQGQGALGGRARANPRVFRRHRTVSERDVALREARIRMRVARILVDGLLEKLESRLAIAAVLHAAQLVHAAQIQFVGRRVDGRPCRQPLAIRRPEPHFNRFCDGGRDVILQSDQIAGWTLERLAPHLAFIGGVDQLRGDLHAIGRAHDRSRHQRPYAERAPDLRQPRPRHCRTGASTPRR